MVNNSENAIVYGAALQLYQNLTEKSITFIVKTVDNNTMSHPFGDLLTRYASRKHGLSQNRIADTAELEASVLSRMCRGERLSGPRARERVLRVILALPRHGAL